MIITVDQLDQVLVECAGKRDEAAPQGGIDDVTFEDLGYDSIALLETLGRLQIQLGVRLDEALVAEARTPAELVAMVNDVVGGAEKSFVNTLGSAVPRHVSAAPTSGLVDLSSPIDAAGYEPDPVVHEVLSPRDGAEHMSSEMREHFGIEIDADELPDGEFLSLDRLTLTTHTGTHVDAPSHYGSRGAPRHIDQMPLEWFLAPGMVLDLTGLGTGIAGAKHLESEFVRIGRRPEPLDIVLLHTGADRRAGSPAYFTEFTGLDGPAVALLLDLGVKVIGTDAFSLDAPFGDIVRRYRVSGDRSVLWPAHVAGRDREYCQIERLANLGSLPSYGFRVSCFPVKIAGAGAGWTRAVALLDTPQGTRTR